MSFPSFEASSGRGSTGVAWEGHQSRAHHRCFPDAVNRGVTNPAMPIAFLSFSATNYAIQPKIIAEAEKTKEQAQAKSKEAGK